MRNLNLVVIYQTPVNRQGSFCEESAKCAINIFMGRGGHSKKAVLGHDTMLQGHRDIKRHFPK